MINYMFTVETSLISNSLFTIDGGEKVFETNDVNTGWDGTFRGVPVQEGVYVYYFRGGTE